MNERSKNTRGQTQWVELSKTLCQSEKDLWVHGPRDMWTPACFQWRKELTKQHDWKRIQGSFTKCHVSSPTFPKILRTYGTSFGLSGSKDETVPFRGIVFPTCMAHCCSNDCFCAQEGHLFTRRLAPVCWFTCCATRAAEPFQPHSPAMSVGGGGQHTDQVEKDRNLLRLQEILVST